MQDIDSFITILERNVDNPITGLCIAHTVAEMIVAAPDPSPYLPTATLLIETAAQNPEFVAVLPTLCSVRAFGEAILASENFVNWLSQIPGDVDLRALNICIRNLLVKYSNQPAALLLRGSDIVAGMRYPAVGLRCAVFQHLELLAPHCRAQIMAIPNITEKLLDSDQDTTVDELLIRRKAQAALGLLQNGPGGAQGGRRVPQVAPPEVLVL
jgi:hypothetical protein